MTLLLADIRFCDGMGAPWSCPCPGSGSSACVRLNLCPCGIGDTGSGCGGGQLITNEIQSNSCAGGCAALGQQCGSGECDDSVCAGSGSPQLVTVSGQTTLMNIPSCMRRSRCGGGAPRKTPAEHGVCRATGFGESGGPREVGDPIDVETGLSKHGHVDISLPSIEARFEFTRFYTSSLDEWRRGQGVSGVSPPFGTNPVHPTTVNWSHSLFSFVHELGGTNCQVSARRTNGSLLSFTGCGSGFMTPDARALELGARLFRTGTGFELYDGNRRFDYNESSGTAWLLSSIRDGVVSTNRPPLALISYSTQCGNKVIRYVTVGGQSPQLTFNYAAAPGVGNCVLSSITFGDQRVDYQYSTQGLARAYGGAFDESYDYPEYGGVFAVRSYGSARIRHQYATVNGQQRVVSLAESVDGSNLIARDTFVSAGCAPNTSCVQTRLSYQRVGSFVGDGSRTPATKTYTIDGDFSVGGDFRTRATTTPGLAAAWSVSGTPKSETFADDRGTTLQNWYAVDAGAEFDAGTAAVPELVRSQTDVNGLTSTFAWVWGTRQTPLLKSVTSPSALVPGASTVTTYDWDTTRNLLKAEFKRGRTQEFGASNWAAWTGVGRVTAVFYRTTPACGAQVGTPDAHDRIVEVHGPCFVANESATTCLPDQKFKVRTIEFSSTFVNAVERETVYPSVEVDPNKVVKCGDGLSTQFINFTESHNNLAVPQQIVGPDGITTNLTWTKGRLTAMSVGQRSWAFVYDADRLTATQTPEGYWVVSCYRPYTLQGGCDPTGPLSTRPTAMVIANQSNGKGASEAMLYTYAPDGTLTETRTVDAAGNVRVRSSQEATPEGDTTFRGLGAANLGGTSMSTFDAAHRVRAFGEGSNVPAFCASPLGSSTPVSPLCSSVEWVGDRVRRITGARGGDVGFEYDDAGNVREVSLSHAFGKRKRAEYVEDDFGNTVQSTVWLKLGQHLDTRRAFDAMGNEVVRQTPEMASANAGLFSQWDGLGRLLRQERTTKTASGLVVDVLLVQEWDEASISPCASWCAVSAACIINHGRQGRLAYRNDATGEIWFNYDQLGNRSVEVVRPRNETVCSPTRTRVFHHRSDGTISSMQYAFGRQVQYLFQAGLRRAVGIRTNTFGGPSPGAMVDLVDQIRWEPFGGVSFYRLKMPDGSRAVTVDARLGDTTASLPSTCGVDDGPEPAVDATGRPRALVVKRGASNFGFADRFSGEPVFAARYRYADAELVGTSSCLLSGAEPLLEGRGYSTASMLAFATREMSGYRPEERWYGVPTSRISATLIPWEEYQTVHLGPSLSPPPVSGPVLPMYREMFDVYNEATSEWGYTVESFDSLTPEHQFEYRRYGPNGEVARREALFEYWGTQTTLWTEVLNGALASGATGGLESVYRSVQNETGFYEYFYDAENRRRIKVYPSGARDEFTFAPSSPRLLTDVGNDDVLSVQVHPIDDYIWLDNKPVAVLRGRLDAAPANAFARLDDFTGDCGRNGSSFSATGQTVGSECGFYFPVSDAQGRIVLVLDQNGAVAGVGEQDPYGAVNQVDVAAGSEHPYAAYSFGELAKFEHLPWAKDATEVRTRLHFFAVDLEVNDDAVLENSNGAPLTTALERCAISGGSCGPAMGRQTTFWVKSRDEGYGPMSVRFRSGAWQPQPMYGVSVDRIEYLRSERGAKPWFPPIRMPGQYFDEETGFHENWNRFYDPVTGRYLSPEPLLQSPMYVSGMTESGSAVPTYAYAMNNPVRYTDPTGLASPAEQLGPAASQAARWVPVVIAGGAGAATGGAGGAAAGGVIVVGGVVVASAAAAATIYVGTQQFPDPGAGTPDDRDVKPVLDAVAHPAGEPGCPESPRDRLNRCRKRYDDNVEACVKGLISRGSTPEYARAICMYCLYNDLVICQGRPHRVEILREQACGEWPL